MNVAKDVSHAAAHYLMALRELLHERGYARGVDIAERVGVSRPAAHLALKSLKERGFVTEDERHFYSFAEGGEALAARLRGNLDVLTRFFGGVLGLAPDEAESNACHIEHHLSESASQALTAFLRRLLDDAEGRALVERICDTGGTERTNLEPQDPRLG